MRETERGGEIGRERGGEIEIEREDGGEAGRKERARGEEN